MNNKFLKSHLDEINNGGIPIFAKKIKYLLWLPIALPIVLIVRLLGPLVRIRFRSIPSGRIGPFSTCIELYLCLRDAGIDRHRNIHDLFYFQASISNHQLGKMWRRALPISNYARILDGVNRLIPGHKMHSVPLTNERNIHNLFEQMPPHLSFTPEEEFKGRSELGKIGIPPETPFVCFNARDSAYLNSAYPAYDWRYHGYRDSTIDNFIPAAEELTRKGYFAIRVGAVVKQPMGTNNPRIIDYAVKHRTDFLDAYLCARCKFYIGSFSGIDSLPAIFRRPCLCTNVIPMEFIHTWHPWLLFIPKKIWSTKGKRHLTFTEIFKSGIGRHFRQAKDYEREGLEVIENTPEEISAVTGEMDDMVNGKWYATEEGEGLQRRFWSIFPHSELHGKILIRIGTNFLRQNQGLLK